MDGGNPREEIMVVAFEQRTEQFLVGSDAVPALKENDIGRFLYRQSAKRNL